MDTTNSPVTGKHFLLYNLKKVIDKEFVLESITSVLFPQTQFNKNKIIDIIEKQLEEGNFFQEVNVVLLDLPEDIINELKINGRSYFKVLPEYKTYALKIIQGKKNSSIPENWGLHSIRALQANKTGEGVNVAILDTGWDKKHPDYNGRTVITNYFTGQDCMDENGHGMHCAGIACGDTSQQNGLRYGVAKKANIYSCKVLDYDGSGAQSDIVKGIIWAVQNDCKVISISIGTQYGSFKGSDPVYHRFINYAMNNDCIVVAGIGNDSDKLNGKHFPITSPADGQYSIAVSAVNYNHKILNEANRATRNLQSINFCAPGTNIYSSWSTHNGMAPNNYHSGTSMATAFVSGIIALLWQDNLDKSYFQIINKLNSINLITNHSWNQLDYGNGILQL